MAYRQYHGVCMRAAVQLTEYEGISINPHEGSCMHHRVSFPARTAAQRAKALAGMPEIRTTTGSTGRLWQIAQMKSL